MTNVLVYSKDTYLKHIGHLLLFSISFIIALLIPVFAAFPTYNDIGAIFVRTASIFVNINALSSAIIVASTMFSLLFLSFAIVAINIIVKHSRTHVRIKKDVLDGLEKYTSRVFVVLLIYLLLVTAANLITYHYKSSGIITAVVGLILIPFFFYAPSAIVIDDRRIWRSMRSSATFFVKRFDYFLLWLVLSILLLTLFDFIFITISGTLLSRYAMLVFDSLFILPFLVVLQSECYMKRFAMLKR
jgi:hypothetical protein